MFLDSYNWFYIKLEYVQALEAEVEKINSDLEDKPLVQASHEEQTMR